MLHIFCVVALAGLLFKAEGAPQQIGHVLEITPPVQLRLGTNISTLLPQRDLHRQIYAGSEVRCLPGGSVKISLLLGRPQIMQSATWTPVPDLSGEYSKWLRENMTTAGRTRGHAPERRALLVGINTYEPPANAKAAEKKPGRTTWQNLEGCVNDVEEMRALLIARFGFKPADVLVLTNQQASRQAILSGLGQHLVEGRQPGDVAFFFFAGHGSQRVNSKSTELDQRDETIVPADSWQGEPDIRDKELRRLFNAALDNGVLLTAMFDSCHSGSTTRGFRATTKARQAEPVRDDAADATDYGPNPEERGALIFAAAQDDQFAEEEAGEIPHGAFTAALLPIMRAAPINQSATEIFLALKARLQTNGRAQEPVLVAIESRRKMGLFGGTEDLSGRVVLAATRAETGEITLQGGQAAGLSVGCQLRKISGRTNDVPVTLEITALEGLTLAKAKILAGSATAISAGDLFEVSRWVLSPETVLRVWLPPGNLSPPQAARAIKLAEALRQSDGVEWVADPAMDSPTHVVGWDGTQWVVQSRNGGLVRFSEDVSAGELLKKLSDESEIKLFFSLPPANELKRSLGKIGAGTANDAVEIVSERERAHYYLGGRCWNGTIQYAWIQPTAFLGEEATSLPARTEWLALPDESEVATKTLARQLTDLALRLAKVRGWLTLEAPGDRNEFPYRLGLSNLTMRTFHDGANLRETTSDETRRRQVQARLPVVRGGDQFSLALHADLEALKEGCRSRWVYVFVLNKNGEGTLLFQGNSQRLPPPPLDGQQYPAYLPLKSAFRIGEPYGVDTYILLASSTAIPDPTVLNFNGVNSDSGSRGANDPLQRLLQSVGAGTRGAITEKPTDWSVERISVRSVER